MGAGDAGDVSLLARDPAGQSVAQAFLEKAIAIDPNYGQALGVLAASHVIGAYNGWADMATASDCRARRTRGGPGRRQRSLGALRVGLRSSALTPLRRFACGVRVGAEPQSEFLAGAELVRPRARFLRPLGGCARGHRSGAAVEPARSFLDITTASRPTLIRRGQL